MVLQAQELLVLVEKFIVIMLKVRLELAIPGLQTQCSSLAIELYSSKAIAGKKLSSVQLVYCIIIYLSFLNSD